MMPNHGDVLAHSPICVDNVNLSVAAEMSGTVFFLKATFTKRTFFDHVGGYEPNRFDFGFFISTIHWEIPKQDNACVNRGV